MIKQTMLAVMLVGFSMAAQAAMSAKVQPELQAAAAQRSTNDFVIQLNEQADYSAAAAAKTRAEKGRIVVEALKAAAARSQPPVIALLKARGMHYQEYWIANAIVTRGTRADIEAVAQRDEVKALHWFKNDVTPGALQPESRIAAKADAIGIEPSIALVHAPEVWALGFKGQGVVVGDHDVGVDWEHPALKGKYRGWDGTAANHDYNWLNAFPIDPFCSDLGVPCDPNGHGTHTTGTMVGDDGEGNQVGMAPEAQWIACRSLLDPVVGVGTIPTYMTCMQWQIAPYPTGNQAAADPAMAPDLVNNSWGCLEGCVPPILKAVNDAIYAAGIIQVVSAGNDGDTCSTLAFPIAVYESSFTVGATDNEDQMASFSSRGPVLTDLSMRVKPNVVAPGVGTLSSVNGGGYASLSGTSMAGPHVAGMVALILSAEPRLKGRVAEVRHLIEQTAVKITTDQVCGGTGQDDIPNNIFGFGRIDVLAAVLARPQLKIAGSVDDDVYTVTVSQPAESKLDATNVVIDVTVPGAAPAQFMRAKLAPGESWTETVEIDGEGEDIAATAQADQVSPVSGAKVSSRGVGRFGGALGLGVLLAFGCSFLLRRRRQ